MVMGTGLAFKGAWVCRGIELNMQNYNMVINLLPLKMGNADVILGVQWLETLGR